MSVTTERPQIGLTWEAFIELPDEQLRHAELHDGEVVQMAPAGRPHQLTLVNLIGALLPWVRAHGGELVPDPHVRIALRWGYQPDLAWYSPERLPASGYYDQAPDLAVEILSPSTRRRDLVRKPAHYFSAGVREMWLVDVDERVIMSLRADGGFDEWVDGDEVASPLLPGFVAPVAEVLAPSTIGTNR
jgi:Uma2 family endonuclease